MGLTSSRMPSSSSSSPSPWLKESSLVCFLGSRCKGALDKMEALDWRLWDFGSLQYVSSASTGEVLCAYGPNAKIQGGPFSHIQAYQGEPVLLGRNGSDEDRSIIFLRRSATIQLSTKAPEGSTDVRETVIVHGADGKMETWSTEARSHYEAQYLELPCGNTKMKLECYWLLLGKDQCNAPLRLYISLPWVMIFEKEAVLCQLQGSNGGRESWRQWG